MFTTSELKKKKEMFDKLQPIYYPLSSDNFKPDTFFISEYLLKFLEGVFPNYSIDLNSSLNMISNLMIDLLENHPKFKDVNINKSTYPVAFNNTTKKNRMYYGGAISVNEEYANNLYNECNFSDKESYIFTVSCFIQLYAEIENLKPNIQDEDISEHLLATYNIMCYYFKTTKNYDKFENMCTLFFLLTKEYLKNVKIREMG